MIQKQEKAFKKSSTLAEQALQSIKIIAAFGQEAKEEDRFSEPLEDARKSGIRFHLFSAIAYGLNNGAFMFIFAITLLFGSLFVTEGVYNDVESRDYTPGDIIAIFFGMMFAAFSLSLAGPNFKSVTAGRQAANAALETINRNPEISLDSENALQINDLQGELKLDNVSFTYKT